MKSVILVFALLIFATSMTTFSSDVHALGSFKRSSAKANRRPNSIRSSSPAQNGGTCSQFYHDLYSHDAIKIRMVFGYKDARPARFVGDRHERLAFINSLTAPCKTGQACGFVRSPENADLFAKDLQVELGRKVRVMVWVVNSSVGSDDEENRHDPLQLWRSHYAQAAFESGLSDTDILFYDGHSRFGGGPDFAPPHLNSKGEVDPAYYTNVRPGVQRLNEKLQAMNKKGAKKSKLKLLGLYSCSSSQHFTQDVRRYSNVKMISSSNLVYFSDALDESLKKISQVMERKCI